MMLLVLLNLIAISYGLTIPGNLNQTYQQDEAAPRFVSGWPIGVYALPKAESGCPGGGWYSDGFVHQDTQDVSNGNTMSDPEHMMASFTSDYIYEYFCVKGNFEGDAWPAGEYCIHRVGEWCPSGFDYGSIYMDDENDDNSNSRAGTLPSGTFDTDTLYNYCCRNDGDPEMGIELPTTHPFYLLPFGETCQKVSQMTESLEYIFYDAEDTSCGNYVSGMHPYVINGKGHDVKIFYCYYY